MNKPLAVAWAALSALPFVYIVYFMWVVLSIFGMDTSDPVQMRDEFDMMFKLHIANIGLIWILIASYIVYVFRTEHVPKDKKALWAVVLFMGSIVAMPIFWFIYVWKPLRSRPA